MLRTGGLFLEPGDHAHLPGQAEEDPGPDLKSRDETGGRFITAKPSIEVNHPASADEPGKIGHGIYFQFWNCNLQMPKGEKEKRAISGAVDIRNPSLDQTLFTCHPGLAAPWTELYQAVFIPGKVPSTGGTQGRPKIWIWNPRSLSFDRTPDRFIPGKLFTTDCIPNPAALMA
jgi:hypothetical protein